MCFVAWAIRVFNGFKIINNFFIKVLRVDLSSIAIKRLFVSKKEYPATFVSDHTKFAGFHTKFAGYKLLSRVTFHLINPVPSF